MAELLLLLLMVEMGEVPLKDISKKKKSDTEMLTGNLGNSWDVFHE